jgi:DNA-binding response OmpR family regulator
MTIDTIASKGRAAEILLVEDNYGDALLTQKAFKKSKLAINITVAGSGEEALDILHRRGKHANAPVPDMVLLDLNLPKKSGKEVLQEIKLDAKLKFIPVVVLTSSRAEMDVVKTYDLHANSYIIKPVSLEKFSEVAATIESYWFSHVVLPSLKNEAGK